MPRKKAEVKEFAELLKPFAEFMATIPEQLKDLTSQVRALQENKEEKKDIPELPVPISPSVQTATTQATPEQQFPIPQEYREIVDQTLNRHFGVQVKGLTDQPAFTLTVVVPKKYSNMSEDEWKTKGADLRSKVISFAEGTNGVGLWADAIFNNLNPEIRSMVIMDRVEISI